MGTFAVTSTYGFKASIISETADDFLPTVVSDARGMETILLGLLSFFFEIIPWWEDAPLRCLLNQFQSWRL